jgi:broad specificity phosphatase PhoE
MAAQQEVYLLRHAHRIDFVLGRDWYEGGISPPLASPRTTDPSLSPLGLAQATETGEFFAAAGGGGISAVLSSPYLRCLQTAHPIAVALGVPLCAEDSVAELPPSFLRGPAAATEDSIVRSVQLEERKHYFPLLDVTYRSDVAAELLHAGDCFGIQQRYWQGIEQWLLSHAGESVVVVTHGWGVPTIAAGLTGVSIAEISPHFPSYFHAQPGAGPDTNAAICSITKLVRPRGSTGPWVLDSRQVNSQGHLTTLNDERADGARFGAKQLVDLNARYFGRPDPERPGRLLPLARTPWPLVRGPRQDALGARSHPVLLAGDAPAGVPKSEQEMIVEGLGRPSFDVKRRGKLSYYTAVGEARPALAALVTEEQSDGDLRIYLSGLTGGRSAQGVLGREELVSMEPEREVPLVSERFPLIPLQYWLFTPELQWQSRGKWRILQGCQREGLRMLGALAPDGWHCVLTRGGRLYRGACLWRAAKAAVASHRSGRLPQRAGAPASRVSPGVLGVLCRSFA